MLEGLMYSQKNRQKKIVVSPSRIEPITCDVDVIIMSNQDHLFCLHFVWFCYTRKYKMLFALSPKIVHHSSKLAV